MYFILLVLITTVYGNYLRQQEVPKYRCMSINSDVSNEFCEDINCVLIHKDFCKPSCKSISDEWCQSMNCSSIYANYCEELKNI
jgi:hypothetical protein